MLQGPWTAITSLATRRAVEPLAASFFSPPIATADQFDDLILKLIATAIVAIVGGVVSALIISGVLKTRVGKLEEKLNEKMVENTDAHKEIFARLRGAELRDKDAEIDARDRYATRAELLRALSDNAGQYSGILTKMDDGLRHVHERLNPLAEAVATLTKEKNQEAAQ